jgi:CelD/BcsL family acetyltransferase involved in cellulose biosynthesis
MTDAIAAAASGVVPNVAWTVVAASRLCQDAALQRDWDRLNAARGDLPFMSAEVIGVAIELLGAGSERLMLGYQGVDLIAMLVVVPQGRLRWRTFQPSQLPLGAWVADPRLSAKALASAAVQAPLGFCLAFSITQIDPHLAHRENDDAITENVDYIDTGWIDMEGSFEAYWGRRGKNLRQNMRKQRNKLATEGTTTEMKVWRQPGDMAAALGRYGELESAGWKATKGTAIHLDNVQGHFYCRLLERAAGRGEAVVYEYRFDDRCVAMNLCLQRNGVLVVLKTTYDETIKVFSPAFMLREEELQTLFAGDQVKRIEYYGRLMDWHTKLTDNKRTLYHLTAYRWPLLKTLARARRRPTAAVASPPVQTSA